MLKITLYHTYFIPLCKPIKGHNYRKDQENRTDRCTTSAIGERLPQRQKPRIPYALSRLLLKSQGLKSTEVRLQTEMSHISVNSWVKRFANEGIHGLETRLGRGSKPIMDCSDEEAVRRAIKNDRLSMRIAKEAWQQATGKEASETFSYALARDIDV